MTEVNDYQRVTCKVSGAMALTLVDAVAAMVEGHPAPTLLWSLAIAYGIDAYGLEFRKWPKEKIQAWMHRVATAGSEAFAAAVVSAEKEGLNATPPKERESLLPGMVIGKEIKGV